MSEIYILRVLSGVRFKKLNNAINNVKEKSGKSKIGIFFDMLNCSIRYGAGYNDYDIFHFYDIPAKLRKTYVTRILNKKIIMRCNDQSVSDDLHFKSRFNRAYEKYLGREWYDVENGNLEKFKEFVEGKEYIFCKPDGLDSGRGIEKLKVSDFESVEKLYDYCIEKQFGVIEQLLTQHPKMALLHPESVNCIRMQTIVVNGKPHLVYAACKAGNGGHFVDNLGFDGINIPVDKETGKLTKIGRTEHRQLFTKHPRTGIEFEGFEIPYFKEAVELCFKIALETPRVNFVGWDCYIGENGPGIIEANDYPDYYFWQLPELTPDRKGILPYFEKLFGQKITPYRKIK
ncbi:MAG: hypothetical protein KBS62_04540 [Oscillospiraceae bacterium]|nr:hypothetical protein [Candidatus Ruminococcus equi]